MTGPLYVNAHWKAIKMEKPVLYEASSVPRPSREVTSVTQNTL
jgi:hypothetical protein